jgi:hypothetical protein
METRQAIYTPDEVAQRGTDFYETKIRSIVEAGNVDRYLAIDVSTGDYAVADQRHDAVVALRDKHPAAQIWGLRIGHIAAAKFGGGSTREKK